MTDNEIKERLFQVWAEHYNEFPAFSAGWKEEAKKIYNYKTIREIGQIMVNDGVDRLIVAKIIRGE